MDFVMTNFHSLKTVFFLITTVGERELEDDPMF